MKRFRVTRSAIVQRCEECPYYEELPNGFDYDPYCGSTGWRVKEFSPTLPEWCPEMTPKKTQWVELPKNSILADFLEEMGYIEAAEELRDS